MASRSSWHIWSGEVAVERLISQRMVISAIADLEDAITSLCTSNSLHG